MSQPIKVMVTYTSDQETTIQKVASAWADLIVDRINELPPQKRMFVYEEVLRQLEKHE